MTAVDPFEELYRHAPCGLLTTTAADEISGVNDTLLAWGGYDRADLIGKPFASLLDSGSRVFYETRHLPVLLLQHEVSEVALNLVRADGSTLPVLINSVIAVDDSGESRGVRTAIFDATQRQEYERDLLHARRLAELSEARVSVLQEASSSFNLSIDVSDVAETVVDIASRAFASTHASVMLVDDAGELYIAAGTNPLFGRVAPVYALRSVTAVTVVNVDDAQTAYPELAAGLRAARLQSLSITPLVDDRGRLGLLICYFARRGSFDAQFFDLQEAIGRQASQTLVRVRLQQRLEHLAHYDVLTGVANRSLLQQRLGEAIDAADVSGHPLALVFIDLDSFKAVNDRLGHAAGDSVLREVAQRLRTGVRENDIVGRIGGDEFVAICENADHDAAASIAERVRLAIRHPIPGSLDDLVVSASIGVATYIPGVDARPSIDLLLNRADDAMYRSKGSGKDIVTLVR